MAIAELKQPLLKQRRRYSFSETGEIYVAAAPYGISCVVAPFAVVANSVSVEYPTAWPAFRGSLSRAIYNFIRANQFSFEGSNKDERLND